jgi:hypothetical protein
LGLLRFAAATRAPLRITSEYDPDLGLVQRFIQQKFAEGATAVRDPKRCINPQQP